MPKLKPVPTLKTRAQFQAVRPSKRKLATKEFIIQVSEHDNDTYAPRVGYVITKKLISNKAVIRNRARRRIKEAMRHILIDDRTVKFQGRDIVIIARKPVLDISFENLKQQFQNAFDKI